MNEIQSKFFSKFDINDEVEFQPMYRQQQEMGISHDPMDGKIVGVRFTEAKVFYDVYSPYWGKIFENIASEKVFSIKKLPAISDEIINATS